MSLTACCLPGTLRYHLARIQELFGIDVETPERRFATEPAIHVQRVIDSGGRLGYVRSPELNVIIKDNACH